MRIQVKSPEKTVNLVLPNGLIFNRGTAWLATRMGRKYAGDAMKDIPPEALNAIFKELRRVKRMHGRWDLVEVATADGEQVLIRL